MREGRFTLSAPRHFHGKRVRLVGTAEGGDGAVTEYTVRLLEPAGTAWPEGTQLDVYPYEVEWDR